MVLTAASADEAAYRVRYEQVVAQLEGALAVQALQREQIALLKEQLVQERALREAQLAAARATGGGSGVDSTLPGAADTFTAAWLREQRYRDVASCFHRLLYPGTATEAPDVQRFWDSVGGAEVWFVCHSAETLSILLSRVERSQLTLRKDYGDVQTHRFLEHIAARLPRLARLSLGRHAYTLDPTALPENAFPALTALDATASKLTNDDLTALVYAMPSLVELNVSGCENLTWEAVSRLAAGKPGLRVTPASVAEFAASQQQAILDQLHDGFVASGTIYLLARLWEHLGGKDGWRARVSPEMLTSLLSRCPMTRAQVSCAAKESHKNEFVQPREATEFFTQVIARLPRLEVLEVQACPQWPIDCAAAVAAGVETPYPALKRLSVRQTAWQPADLLATVASIPSLERTGSAKEAIEVLLSDGPSGVDVVELRKECDMKLYIWAN